MSNQKTRRLGKVIANRLRKFADKLDKPDVTVQFESNLDFESNVDELADSIRCEVDRRNARIRNAMLQMVAQSGVRMATRKNSP